MPGLPEAPKTNEPRFRESFDTLVRAGKLIWTAGPRLVAGVGFLRLASALLPLGLLFVSRRVIDDAVQATQGKTVASTEAWALLMAGFGLTVAIAVLSRATDYLELRLADEFSRTASLRVMTHASTLDLTWIEDPKGSDMLERARAQSTDRMALLTSVGTLLQRVVALTGLAITLVSFKPWLFALLLACVLPALAGESHFARRGYLLAHQLTASKRKLDYLRLLGSSRESAKEIKTFNLSVYLHQQYETVSANVILASRRLARRRLAWGALFTTIGTLGYYGGYAYLVLQAFQGRLSAGTLTLLAGALVAALGELQGLSAMVSSLSEQALFLYDLIAFLDVRPIITAKNDGRVVPRPIARGFEFKNVSFKYPDSDKWVLRELSLTIRPGERVALVGENGGGKTTIVKLLTRLYQPTSGGILLDGVDLADYRLEDLHKEIGVIYQDFFRFDMPVRQNIAVGNVDRVRDDHAVWDAARKGGADEILSHLPQGLEQMLGRRFEGGVDLSGGQWQTVALSRAYFRDAQILVMDEPTASLDAMAEAEVFSKFAEFTRDRMALLISHRFSTVRMADRILVLVDGSIAEEGSHKELLASGGRYAGMFETQAALYR